MQWIKNYLSSEDIREAERSRLHCFIPVGGIQGLRYHNEWDKHQANTAVHDEEPAEKPEVRGHAGAIETFDGLYDSVPQLKGED